MTARRALYLAAAGCALAGIIALLAASVFLIRLTSQLDALTTETTLTLQRAQVAAERAEADVYALVGDLRILEDGVLAEVAAARRATDVHAGEAVRAFAGVARNANDSWDDMFWDIKAVLESTAVAARGVAEASEAAGKAAPAVSESLQAIAGETATTMREIRKVAPEIAANLKQTSGNFCEITGEAARVAPETAEAVKRTAQHAERISGIPARLASPFRWLGRGIKKLLGGRKTTND